MDTITFDEKLKEGREILHQSMDTTVRSLVIGDLDLCSRTITNRENVIELIVKMAPKTKKEKRKKDILVEYGYYYLQVDQNILNFNKFIRGDML